MFLILIAVALFAALSYAVTQSGRGSGSLDREQALLEAVDIVQYVALVEQAWTRLLLTGGCTRQQISFDFSPGSGGEKNANAPSDLSCHIFSSNGGGVRLPDEMMTAYSGQRGWTEVDRYAFPGIGVSNDTSGSYCIGCELFFVYHGLSDEACRNINSKYSPNADFSANDTTDFPDMFYVHYNAYDGDFSTTGGYWYETEAGGELNGAQTFCVKEYNGNEQNVFLHLLWAR
ncbi:MAG: hypothetical protein OXT65_03205 [Alphaproteobacteria bacterium]|nr:hypothetical protein [Alphaproteobacteria bacterium]